MIPQPAPAYRTNPYEYNSDNEYTEGWIKKKKEKERMTKKVRGGWKVHDNE